MNHQWQYIDSRLTRIEMILEALLHALKFEAVVNIEKINEPILRKL